MNCWVHVNSVKTIHSYHVVPPSIIRGTGGGGGLVVVVACKIHSILCMEKSDPCLVLTHVTRPCKWKVCVYNTMTSCVEWKFFFAEICSVS